MSKSKKSSETVKSRDFNIAMCASREINLGTKTVKDKTKYSRKDKHKKSFLD